ncbi:MAG: hydrogenase iron-sulfur subunit [Deltaproteobacteria bacterium]|nr:hydrogenase iron-sulfur subunit [Deltaproteobacteria bacterium]
MDSPRITIFHCTNTLSGTDAAELEASAKIRLQTITMACSGMTKDVFLLRAFESGADAVVVLACPEDACRHMQGSIRARKRVEWVKDLLDEIGISGERLSFHNVVPGDSAAIRRILKETAVRVREIDPNPARAA